MASDPSPGLLFADLTQSWSSAGGGVRTYLQHKRRHILDNSNHRHLLIVPGERDSVTAEQGGRAITVTLASPPVPGSPNYRLLMRNRAVRDILADFRPDLIECQDAYNLPWVALGHARRNPGAATVAAYCTDFPTVYVERPLSRRFGAGVGEWSARLCYRYCAALYSRFDAVYAMSNQGGAQKLRGLGLADVAVVPLGVELGQFSPDKRDDSLRACLGLDRRQPLLIYAGRLDREKRPQMVVEAFRRLPAELGAVLVLLGDGPMRPQFVGREAERIFAPGYCQDREDLARWLASADLYVTAMADETFGLSVIEAQASGLAIVGVAAGAMLDRVPPGLGLVGAVDDPSTMAANILQLVRGDLSAIRKRAREHALQFSWAQSMERLFGQVYATARMRAAARTSPAVGEASLAPIR